jgi:hypothetical protein
VRSESEESEGVAAGAEFVAGVGGQASPQLGGDRDRGDQFAALDVVTEQRGEYAVGLGQLGELSEGSRAGEDSALRDPARPVPHAGLGRVGFPQRAGRGISARAAGGG